jgi:hypothetical protein
MQPADGCRLVMGKGRPIGVVVALASVVCKDLDSREQLVSIAENPAERVLRAERENPGQAGWASGDLNPHIPSDTGT